jgi:GntR family transcriptional regulator, galactonate operon transcriptional repressor
MSTLRTRHQEAVDQIANWIVGGRFSAGTVLPREEDIGGELRVSRTVVREAMRTLVAKGMVEVRRRHGTRVTPIDSWSLFDPQVVDWRMTRGLTREFIEDLIRFRLGIEPYAAGLAAANPDFPVHRLNDAFARMSTAVDGIGSYHEADLDFHETIILGANNQFLRQLVPLMTNTLRASFSLSVISLETARGSLPMHRAVADAIIFGDSEGARRALTTLIEEARKDIIGVLPNIVREERAHAERDRVADPGD